MLLAVAFPIILYVYQVRRDFPKFYFPTGAEILGKSVAVALFNAKGTRICHLFYSTVPPIGPVAVGEAFPGYG